jgi:hypothetical protein
VSDSRRIPAHWLVLPIVYIAVCAAIDFFPHHGAPNFRYTGSNPSQPVWNFGWPLATLIYDARHGLQFGPFTVILIPLEIFGLLLLVALQTVIHFVRRLLK